MKVEDLGNLLSEFWQTSSDACPLEAGHQEEQEENFKAFVEKKLKEQSFKEASSFMMKWLSENKHPHVMAQITSTEAILWEGQVTFQDNQYEYLI